MSIRRGAALALATAMLAASAGEPMAQILGNPLGNPPMSTSRPRPPQGSAGFNDDDVELGTVCRSQRTGCKLATPLPVGGECQCKVNGKTIRGLVARPRR